MTGDAQAEAERILRQYNAHRHVPSPEHGQLVAALTAAIHWQDADSISSYYELHRALSVLREPHDTEGTT